MKNTSVETGLLVTGKNTVPSMVHSHCPFSSFIRAPGPVQVWTPAASNSRTMASRDKVASKSRRKSPKNSSLNVSAVKPQKLASNGLIFIQRISSLNPYWQIMENSSRKFSEMFIFRVVTQAVLLENSSIKNHEYLFSFFQFWGVTQTVLLENSSRQFFKSFFNFFNLFKLRQKKPLFLEEKQVNDET